MKGFKVFRTFWPCSFVDPLVKGTDNFWKVRGIIDRFNESCRQSDYGVEKSAYELMSAMLVCTTPKGDLPHCSYIFRKPDPFGTEMKNVACSRLGKMVHLDIQKGKEAMKTLGFQKDLGGTAVCMKRLAMDSKGCVQMTSNYTYFTYGWSSSVETAEDVMAAGVDYCGPAKTTHKGFYMATLETLITDWPVGSYLVINSTPRVPGGRPLLATGYKYNYKNVLEFIATEGGGSTEPGDPYLSFFPDIYFILSIRPVFVLTC